MYHTQHPHEPLSDISCAGLAYSLLPEMVQECTLHLLQFILNHYAEDRGQNVAINTKKFINFRQTFLASVDIQLYFLAICLHGWSKPTIHTVGN